MAMDREEKAVAVQAVTAALGVFLLLARVIFDVLVTMFLCHAAGVRVVAGGTSGSGRGRGGRPGSASSGGGGGGGAGSGAAAGAGGGTGRGAGGAAAGAGGGQPPRRPSGQAGPSADPAPKRRRSGRNRRTPPHEATPQPEQVTRCPCHAFSCGSCPVNCLKITRASNYCMP